MHSRQRASQPRTYVAGALLLGLTLLVTPAVLAQDFTDSDGELRDSQRAALVGMVHTFGGKI
jgi:hypothetical protein